MARNLIAKVISLDYDNTYTVDPVMWLNLVQIIQSRGHRVLLITMRTPEEITGTEDFEAIDPDLLELVDEVIPTSRKAKKPYMESLGRHVDIWIDDTPEFLLFDAR